MHGGVGADVVAAPLPAVTATSEAPSSSSDSGKLALDPAADPNAQQRKADFIAGQDWGGEGNAYRLTAVPSPDLLSAGSVIAASLSTGLRSDLPGI